MIRGAITEHIDVAQVVLYAFFIFFAGLIWYLRQEDRREGYPLECDATGKKGDRGFLFIPKPKTFHRADGRKIAAPAFDDDPRPINGARVSFAPGSPMDPIGDPLLAGVGPGAYALRSDTPEKTWDGRNLLAPLRVASNYAVAAEDVDPIGLPVLGADHVRAGVVKDLWVDRSESALRYYEIALDLGGAVLLPSTFANVDRGRKLIRVDAILGGQFAKVPTTRSADEVTLREEDKIMAYYGAGTLYATAQRTESWI